MDPVSETPTEPVDYAALNMVWAGLAAGVIMAADRAKGEAPPGRELPLLGLASFALTKAIAKEKVGTWARAPLVDESPVGRRPKGRRLRYAAGELLTCTRCLGTWSSLGLVGLRVVRPREGQIVTTVLATAGVNDWLQTGFSWLRNRSNVTEREAEMPEEALAGRFSRSARAPRAPAPGARAGR
jgi:hypothetical protein